MIGSWLVRYLSAARGVGDEGYLAAFDLDFEVLQGIPLAEHLPHRIQLVRPEPDGHGEIPGPEAQARGVRHLDMTLQPVEITGPAHHPGERLGPGVRAMVAMAGGILEPVAQVPCAHVAGSRIENGFGPGNPLGLGISRKQVQGPGLVRRQGIQAHPDFRLLVGLVPALDLEG